jgi:hypothetical protein
MIDLDAVTPLVLPLAESLRARGWRMAAAESCTGGLLAAACTSVAGSSDWFERGFVTYSNAAKTEQLGVDAATDRGARRRQRSRRPPRWRKVRWCARWPTSPWPSPALPDPAAPCRASRSAPSG